MRPPSRLVPWRRPLRLRGIERARDDVTLAERIDVDLPIGEASQFDSDDEIYDFAAPGSYTVRVVAPGGAERTFIVTAGDDAERDIAVIEAKLE